ncbi:hypothetical protein HOD05_00525 [Candidatus Woesearchaeota archaeon]|jgi:hypothetical protein|nr:hypothetical protein [Candidatus Woesearchaeota archaeon]MBT4150892.1 hypothetical protein [Candidatus Woesearchaeota archaeon]MBT4247564.1 hypothetical protein [Candidatus Woesearchaeota archaeon]MBT4433682.1 hypothetical protein [Candidatus Woesearchaeota archaeon]MBT7332107.1 hypothetical protein [Candidatus Woesearchaeota archaeon]
MVKYTHSVQLVYQKSLSAIKRYTGLKDLSLIEKVALRGISSNVVGAGYLNDNIHSQFRYAGEITAIFLDRYYGFPASTTKDISYMLRTRRKLRQEKGYDVMAEYFQMKQEKAHMP